MLIVLAKQPLPGRVKTRLTPPLTSHDAADVAAAALSDTLDAVDATGEDDKLLSFDGDPLGWLRPDWRHVAQPDDTLDVRISAAFAVAGAGPALLIGMDTPQVTPALLTRFDPLRFDACLGPAVDGGYWAIGFADSRHALDTVPGVPMSHGDTGRRQLQRLWDAGLRVQLLPVLEDVDTVAAARRVQRAAPRSAFARQLDRAGSSCR